MTHLRLFPETAMLLDCITDAQLPVEQEVSTENSESQGLRSERWLLKAKYPVLEKPAGNFLKIR